MTTAPDHGATGPCPVSPCDWDLEGTLDEHLYCDHEAEDLASTLVRIALDNDRLRLAAENKSQAIEKVRGLCAEYSEAEGRGLAPRGSAFVHWVRSAIAEEG